MNENSKLERLAARHDTTDTTRELVNAAAPTDDAPPTGEPMTTFAVRLPVAVLNHVREVAAPGIWHGTR